MRRIGNCLWEIPPTGGMRVPARIYASEKMIPQALADQAYRQAMHVAHLPGIVGASLAMPDIHQGYGFPIGGVAAFDARTGVISPGGVGYDINCGVRFMATRLTRDEVKPRLEKLMPALFHEVPAGLGSAGPLQVSRNELEQAAIQGARWAVSKGYGTESDLRHIEEEGCLRGANPDRVSARAWQRGLPQLGTLGSGNHFLEIGYVDEIYDETAARTMGLSTGLVTVIIHCGSRGFGYQICDDYLALMRKAATAYGIALPDPELACAPLDSPEGKAYLAAMTCAINYAFANREIIAHRVRETLSRVFRQTPEAIGLRTVYEVAHNIAKWETHTVEGRERTLCVHRKGATRAFAPGHAAVPSDYRSIGQPVLIPGDMGRYSYVLTGTEQAMRDTFGSTSHGAGRRMSRHEARRAAHGRDIAGELRHQDVLVIGQERGTLDEEMPEAYKDVADVVDACVQAGLSNKVCRLRPMGCLKG